MRAITYGEYGDADVLRIDDVEVPVPAADELLVKVHAASLNPYDWHFMTGLPYFSRVQFGLRGPKSNRLGADLAGTVAAVGADVTCFRPGDEVFGGVESGSLAEYVAVPESCVAINRPTRPSARPRPPRWPRSPRCRACERRAACGPDVRY